MLKDKKFDRSAGMFIALSFYHAFKSVENSFASNFGEMISRIGIIVIVVGYTLVLMHYTQLVQANNLSAKMFPVFQTSVIAVEAVVIILGMPTTQNYGMVM